MQMVDFSAAAPVFGLAVLLPWSRVHLLRFPEEGATGAREFESSLVLGRELLQERITKKIFFFEKMGSSSSV